MKMIIIKERRRNCREWDLTIDFWRKRYELWIQRRNEDDWEMELQFLRKIERWWIERKKIESVT